MSSTHSGPSYLHSRLFHFQPEKMEYTGQNVVWKVQSGSPFLKQVVSLLGLYQLGPTRKVGLLLSICYGLIKRVYSTIFQFNSTFTENLIPLVYKSRYFELSNWV